MSDQAFVVAELAAVAGRGERCVLATVVGTAGSAYRGVGARMLVRADGSTAGLVSGGCLEADLVARAARVREGGRPELFTYDGRGEDELAWGLGIGCNGLVEVLLEPLAPREAGSLAELLGRAMAEEAAPPVIATVVVADARSPGAAAPVPGARLLVGARTETWGDWGDGALVAPVAAEAAELRAGDRAWRGAAREHALAEGGAVRVAFERVAPPVRLVVCGSGPDVVPVVRFAAELGWDVTVVDHRPPSLAHAERFPGARVVECADSARLAGAVSLSPRTAAVVMSHHYGRDTDYLAALLDAGVGYVGLLGPRARADRMLADLAARGRAVTDDERARLYAPVGLDVGGDGPEAIALAVVAEVSAVAGGRAGGHLRGRTAPLHGAPR